MNRSQQIFGQVALYSVYCTVYNVQCTLYSVYGILCYLHCTIQYNLPCIYLFCILIYTQLRVHCSLYNALVWFTHTQTHKHTDIHTHTNTHINTHEHTNTHKHTHKHTHTYTHTYTHKYIHIHTHTHKHTHTHTYTQIHTHIYCLYAVYSILLLSNVWCICCVSVYYRIPCYIDTTTDSLSHIQYTVYTITIHYIAIYTGVDTI